jgi:hypothetical protein
MATNKQALYQYLAKAKQGVAAAQAIALYNDPEWEKKCRNQIERAKEECDAAWAELLPD